MESTGLIPELSLANLFSGPNPQVDISLLICSFLDTDKDRVLLLSTCRFARTLKGLITYKKTVTMTKIINTGIFNIDFYNQITHVKATGRMICDMRNNKLSLPTNLTHLTLQNYKGYLQTITRHLKNLKCLTVTNSCRITVNKGCLPKTLTHLTWETAQQLPCDNGIPIGLIDLRLANYQHPLPKLPNTIIYLTFGKGCQFTLEGKALPLNLKVLTINTGKLTFNNNNTFNNNIDYPANFQKIIFGKFFNNNISPYISDTVKECVFWYKIPDPIPTTIKNVKYTLSNRYNRH